jgi:uncharacterized protein (TIGR04255 family)
MPFTDPTGYAIIHQKVDAAETKESIPVIFDTDAFLPIVMDPASETMWERFEDLHQTKNTVFFGSLTDQALELYR